MRSRVVGLTLRINVTGDSMHPTNIELTVSLTRAGAGVVVVLLLTVSVVSCWDPFRLLLLPASSPGLYGTHVFHEGSLMGFSMVEVGWLSGLLARRPSPSALQNRPVFNASSLDLRTAEREGAKDGTTRVRKAAHGGKKSVFSFANETEQWNSVLYYTPGKARRYCCK